MVSQWTILIGTIIRKVGSTLFGTPNLDGYAPFHLALGLRAPKNGHFARIVGQKFKRDPNSESFSWKKKVDHKGFPMGQQSK